MIKKIMAAALILSPLAAATPALATVNDGCNYYGYDCYRASTTNYNVYSSNTNYGNSYSFNPQPDPNALANSYSSSHQTTSSNSNCNYYGYDCYTPSTAIYTNTSSTASTYVVKPDPNDLANTYYAQHPYNYGYGKDYSYYTYPQRYLPSYYSY